MLQVRRLGHEGPVGWRSLWSSLRRRRGFAWAVVVGVAGCFGALATVSAAPGAAASPCGTSGVLSSSGAMSTCTYGAAGGEDTFTVPSGVSSLTVVVDGAAGGSFSDGVNTVAGGAGGEYEATLTGAILGGGVLAVFPGQAGGQGSVQTVPVVGGFGLSGGGGGAASTIASGGTLLVVAGGGGGAAAGGSGGAGGGSSDTNGHVATPSGVEAGNPGLSTGHGGNGGDSASLDGTAGGGAGGAPGNPGGNGGLDSFDDGTGGGGAGSGGLSGGTGGVPVPLSSHAGGGGGGSSNAGTGGGGGGGAGGGTTPGGAGNGAGGAGGGSFEGSSSEFGGGGGGGGFAGGGAGASVGGGGASAYPASIATLGGITVTPDTTDTNTNSGAGSVTISYATVLTTMPALGVPVNVSPPVIAGTPAAGQTLTCTSGTWTNAPTAYTYTWSLDGTPIPAVTGSTYTVLTIDEGSTLTCTVTARNATGASAPARSAGVAIRARAAKGCPVATGAITGTRIGPVKLGLTRRQAKRAFPRSADRGKRYEDFFCLIPIGTRVGYASPNLLATLPAHERRTLAARVVWISTSNPIYAIHGIRAGATLAAAQAAIHLHAPLVIGRNTWYLGPAGPVTAVLKVRHALVQEIGIANPSLARTGTGRRTLMHSFS